MPRVARKPSKTNVYHVMLRGNEQRQVFQDAEDNERFLEILIACKALSGFEVFAYCLMGNHVHLLMRTGEKGEQLGQIFRRLGAQYVYWYNGKYERVGHLFQDRFLSEPVEDDAYLLSVVRYIHQNPVKAGMVQDMVDYPYTSYREYLKPEAGQLTDTAFMYGIMDREAFIAYHEKADDLEHLDIQPVRPKMSDEQAKRLIAQACGCYTVEDFANLDKTQRMYVLAELKKRNASYRQISRLTGESIGIIRKE
jgi:putative transposase